MNMKRNLLKIIFFLLLFLVGCEQNISEKQPILEKEVQLKALWGNIFIMEERVLDSSTFLKGSFVSESRRVDDVNYIAYYSKESDVAYLEVTEDGKCEKHDINGLFILEKAVGEEVSVDIKYYED